ncbi:MAG: maltotransferase domain-containing protein, partial [Propionicimonas sp.]
MATSTNSGSDSRPSSFHLGESTAAVMPPASTEPTPVVPPVSGVGPRPLSLPRGFGRIPVAKVSPVIEGGAYPAKAAVGELIPIRAKVFREGHDAVNASVILTDPHGHETRVDMQRVE